MGKGARRIAIISGGARKFASAPLQETAAFLAPFQGPHDFAKRSGFVDCDQKVAGEPFRVLESIDDFCPERLLPIPVIESKQGFDLLDRKRCIEGSIDHR